MDTNVPKMGPVVTCIGYRNPVLRATLATTVAQLAGGRFVFVLGAGWFERDYAEYGYDFGETRDRVRLLKESLPRIKRRIEKLRPGPAGRMAILIPGGGEKGMLRPVAEHAPTWDTIGAPEQKTHTSKGP